MYMPLKSLLSKREKKITTLWNPAPPFLVELLVYLLMGEGGKQTGGQTERFVLLRSNVLYYLWVFGMCGGACLDFLMNSIMSWLLYGIA